ncbi:bifunctional 2-C-methyl-D-erythritol 4-phosphate cytidylyltransferase/2-C-methyl-D-erythritol 2,4-cyclodiphosphate synthase [Roseibium sp. RKSG952]|uniref:bifunctional 2-C-methyl-D-erythritol 4-phosphate cytidylyltransferase/2-C-methyl-D-erythritol 2,4-cyclodiphosphate synthase n=1 Tax=Roseibium sp. RKSG952 TaxID=2529384 RepID=UPI0012BB620D|nr:bifunctional 2-C-methyl-D-erythritol 4-phosphate cytidylyltransferase/2-C-methyl-D-erythritol 2,4-cyclodiphosphate synthase [Roseibium sp. RKSG952]MTH96880.1 bifunctional 2-C-methyl-D-erythritol 4-phosphate cytidylyltransferase/2-C-methyl-D-erythritol 2,4-cyclodiphosphate synthase [Roseibium sp. RKSG952]
MTTQIAALIVAAGRGRRFGATDREAPKQYHRLAGRPVLSHTLDAFLSHPRISHVLVVISPDDLPLYEHAAERCQSTRKSHLLPPETGGESRQISVHNGLTALSAHTPDLVLIHDGARPLVSRAVIEGVIGSLENGTSACLAATPVFDTLKRKSDKKIPLETVDRTSLFAAQTPQGFAYAKILKAHEHAARQGLTDFTDDTGLAEWAGLSVELAPGDTDNLKITMRGDLQRAERILKMTQLQSSPPLASLPDIRVGSGYDVHALEPGDGVILCGIKIPFDRKLKGHSDADVALHAVTDAILGAIADGDIGMHFPPSDPQWKGAASDQFLQEAIQRVEALGGRLAHIDVTIVCEAPKIGPHRDALRQSMAGITQLPLNRISVKATTSEKLGFTGRSEGIAAMASATVRLPFIDA